MKNYLRIDEVAEELDCSSRTVRRLIEDGKLLAFAIREGGSLRVPAESFRAYVKDQISAYQEEYCIEPQETVTGVDND